MNINIDSQIVVQTAAQWAADNTVYSDKRILVTSDAYYGSTDQRKFKIADGTQTWSQLDYMTLVQNGATNTYLPKSNGTDLVNSLLYEYADGIKIPNGKFITNPNAQAAVYFAADYVALLGIGANFNEFESVYVSPATAGLKSSVNNFLVSEAARMIAKHDTKVEIDTPTILLTQATASRIVETDASKNLTYAAKGTAYNKNFGVSSGDILLLGSTSVASQILATDANNQVQTLTTATYPSLTELSYVKGATSAVQTQLNAKPIQVKSCASLQNHSPSDNTTLYFGSIVNATPNVTSTNRQFYLKTGTLKIANLTFYSNTTLGSNENVTLYLRNITDATSSLIGTITMDVLASAKLITGLSIATDSSKLYSIEVVFPAFATNPTNCQYSAELEIY